MQIPQFIQQKEDYKKCIAFHGHTCMGVTIGYLAAKLALEELKIARAVDEELVAIVENDACCCDAIQVLTGCTFGKGNFFFKDYGKMAFTFGKRNTGEALRLVLKPDVFNASKEEQRLLEKIQAGMADQEEIKRYEIIGAERAEQLFSQGPGAFFHCKPVDLDLPPRAQRASSEPCDLCAEMVMQSKLLPSGERRICADCMEQENL